MYIYIYINYYSVIVLFYFLFWMIHGFAVDDMYNAHGTNTPVMGNLSHLSEASIENSQGGENPTSVSPPPPPPSYGQNSEDVSVVFVDQLNNIDTVHPIVEEKDPDLDVSPLWHPYEYINVDR